MTTFTTPAAASPDSGYRSWSLLLLVILGLCLPAQDGVAQQRTRFLRWAAEDARAFVVELGPPTPYYALAGAAILAPITLVDEPIRNAMPDDIGGPIGGYLDFTNELGSTLMAPVVAGVFGASLLTSNTSFQNTAFSSLEAFVYATTITRLLKGAFGRKRPHNAEGAYEFDPFSSQYSFPSGHATAAFAVITPWALSSGKPATFGLFALSLGTAVSRVTMNKHWTTDVLAGSAIGFFTARFFTRRRMDGEGPSRVSFQPIIRPGTAGISLKIGLDQLKSSDHSSIGR